MGLPPPSSRNKRSSGGKTTMLPSTGFRRSLGMTLNLLLLLAMVATNLLSLYHLTTTTTLPSTLNPITTVPSHLVSQLSTIRSSITHLTTLSPSGSTPSSSKLHKPPPELLLLSKTSPIATSCIRHPDLLHRYMNYTPFLPCPPLLPPDLPDLLILLGCHPLPRRRCFAPSPNPHIPTTTTTATATATTTSRSNLDLAVPILLRLAQDASALPIRLALDVAGGTAPLAAEMRAAANATVLTTTLDLGGTGNGAAAARRGVVPLHVPLQQRFPVPDGSLDLVRLGRAVNRWIPTDALGFLLYDVDRILRTGGLLWIDHFFSRKSDLLDVYAPLIRKLGYRILKWTTANKTDGGGAKIGEVYLTALLQKHPSK